MPPLWTKAEPYSVLEFRLDEARDEEEVNYPGDNITAATNGTLAGISIKFQSKRNQATPLDSFNPITYPSGFAKFYLTNTQQAGKKLRLFIGRAVGAAAPTFVATQTVKTSGEIVIAKVSGETVIAKISGEKVDIIVPTAIKTGAILTPTALSGGAIVTSGAVKAATFKSLSGDVYLGGTAVGDRPYSGYGFLLAFGEAASLDIDNFGRARICAPHSGDWVSYIGVS